MSESKLAMGILIGAAAGGLAALCDRKTRNAVKKKVGNAKNTAGYYMKNPAEGVHQLRTYYEEVSNEVYTNTEKVQKVLTEVQNFVDSPSNTNNKIN